MRIIAPVLGAVLAVSLSNPLDHSSAAGRAARENSGGGTRGIVIVTQPAPDSGSDSERIASGPVETAPRADRSVPANPSGTAPAAGNGSVHATPAATTTDKL